MHLVGLPRQLRDHDRGDLADVVVEAGRSELGPRLFQVAAPTSCPSRCGAPLATGATWRER